MCGVVAMIAREGQGFMYADRTIFQNLLILDTFRGLDSTGAFMVESNHNVQYAKLASHPYHLFATDLWDKLIGRAVSSGRIMVGHNRRATQGAINSHNAHPFHENNIILVHNGTLRGGHKKLGDVDVDSNAIAVAFNEKGAKNILPTLEGAFALVWWDVGAKKLFAIRNEERPLSIVVTKEVLYLASEPWMVQAAAGREGRKLLETIDCTPGNLYEFDTRTGTYKFEPVKLLSSTPVTFPESGANMSKKVSGALAVVKVNHQQKSPEVQVETKKETPMGVVVEGDPLPPIQAANILNVDFPRGREVLMRVYEAKKSANGMFFTMRGKTMEPGAPSIDSVLHVAAAQVPERELHKWIGNPVIGKVRAYTHGTCGPSIFVREGRIDAMRDVFNGAISEHEWLHVLVDGKCHECGANITNDDDAPFTRCDRTSTNNTMRVTCPDCVEDKLIPGDIKNEFTKRRSDAVQANVAVGQKLADGVDTGPQNDGAPTLH